MQKEPRKYLFLKWKLKKKTTKKRLRKVVKKSSKGIGKQIAKKGNKRAEVLVGVYLLEFFYRKKMLSKIFYIFLKLLMY